MAHFAELDENNVVLRVIVVNNDDISDANGVESEELGIAFCKKLVGLNTNWKQTSYNRNFRKHYAGIGYTYRQDLDAFVPVKPYDSWLLNTELCVWESPIGNPPELTETERQNQCAYTWNEQTTSWDLFCPDIPQ